MQKLIASGCSWTRYRSHSTWPEVLSQKLGMECVNLGASAAGNEYIFSSILDEVMHTPHSKIGLVVAMWSEWIRWDFEDKETKRWNHLSSGENELNGDLHDKFTATNRTLRYIYMFQELMEHKNIPYMHIQGIKPYWHPIEERNTTKLGTWYLKDVLGNIYTEQINEDKFINWPPFLELGGNYMDFILNELDPDEKNLYVLPHGSGAHPNEEGHKVMADYFLKEIEKEYGNL